MNPTRPTIACGPFRYYCHNCCTGVHVTESYNCIVCSGGFVEEISTMDSNSILERGTIPNRSYIENVIDNNAEQSDSYESLASTNSGTNETEQAAANIPQPSNIGNALINGVFDVVDIFRGGRNNAPTQSRASTSRQAMNTEELRDRIHSLLVALGEERRRNMNGNDVVATDSNPQSNNQASDLENMLMRTLRLLFSVTSRPLTNQRLDLIPKVNINSEDLANHPRCSICWEEFKIDESVRKLPCSHLHHEQCIFPWIEIHRTCPLCRYRLIDESDFEDCNPEGSQVTLDSSGFELDGHSSVEVIGADLDADEDNSTETQ